MPTTEQIIQRYIRGYSRLLNDFLGLLAFNAAIACISTDAPRLYGFITLLFITFVWAQALTPYRRVLKLLREVGHPAMATWTIVKRSAVFLIGWMFLGCVAVGYFDKTGFVGF